MSLIIRQLDHVVTHYDNDFHDVTLRLPETTVRKGNIPKFPWNVQEYFRITVSKRTLRNIASWLIKETKTREFTEVK